MVSFTDIQVRVKVVRVGDTRVFLQVHGARVYFGHTDNAGIVGVDVRAVLGRHEDAVLLALDDDECVLVGVDV